MLKELNVILDKELKEIRRMRSQKIENINRETKNISK